MIRTPQWKLVRHLLTNGLDELYNLKDDPDETRNLYRQAQHKETLDALQKRLSEWQRTIHDPLAWPDRYPPRIAANRHASWLIED
jgi:arylsulfatase A-like enzyme